MTFLLPFRPYQAFVEIEGALFHYRSRGEGPPVLFLHGIPGDLRSLEPVTLRLASPVETVTVSLPVPPAGARPARPFGTAAQRDDLVDLIWSLGRGPVHLVAWSYAAHAAMAVASDRPDLVRSLVLYEPGFPTFLDEAESRIVGDDTTAAFAPVAAALAHGDEAEALRLAIDGAAGRAGHFEDQPEAVRRVHFANAASVGALFRQTPVLGLGPADLRAIRCPATVARGAETRTCYRIVSDGAARLIPGSTPVIVPGAGHLLPEEDPSSFAHLIDRHLSRAAVAATHVRGEDAA